jgi:spermidine/putrescine transport system permease protein
MQASIANVTEIKGPQRPPGWRGWLLVAPMLLWLVAFVVVPTAILVVYSFGEQGEDEPVKLAFTTANYQRVVEGTDLQPLLRIGLIAIVIAGAWAAIRYFRGSEQDVGGRRKAALKAGWLVFAVSAIALIWENFDDIFSGIYVQIFIRSVGYAGLTTALCIAIGFPVAYYIGRAPENRRNLLLLLVMIPFWTSFLIRTYAWLRILAEEGLLNGLLLYSHAISEPFEILYTRNAVLIGLVYSYLPFMILPIYGSVEKLDNALIEAAFDLGAGPVRAFQKVIVPLTKPGIIAGALLVFVPAIGMFAITDLMGGKTVPMIGNVIQNQFGQARDWPFGSALGISLLVLFALALWFTTRKSDNSSVMG